jgi:hypothetical protein
MNTKPLTVPQATSQARKHVNKLMPGVMATVESKLSHDLATDTPTVVTTVTLPAGHVNAGPLSSALRSLPGIILARHEPARIVLTRTR